MRRRRLRALRSIARGRDRGQSSRRIRPARARYASAAARSIVRIHAAARSPDRRRVRRVRSIKIPSNVSRRHTSAPVVARAPRRDRRPAIDDPRRPSLAIARTRFGPLELFMTTSAPRRARELFVAVAATDLVTNVEDVRADIGRWACCDARARPERARDRPGVSRWSSQDPRNGQLERSRRGSSVGGRGVCGRTVSEGIVTRGCSHPIHRPSSTPSRRSLDGATTPLDAIDDDATTARARDRSTARARWRARGGADAVRGCR